MTHTFHNPENVPKPAGRYSQAVEVRHPARFLYLSGQVGAAPDGNVPETFEEQCHLIYQNIVHLLEAANMKPTDLVKLTTFLTLPDKARITGQIRSEYLGDHMPASTTVVAQLLNSKWLLEVEAVAAAEE